MPQPGRQELSRVEVSKATKSGKKDARYSGPIRVESQTKKAANEVIKAGNERKGRTVDAGLGVDAAPKKQMSAKAAARADMESAGWVKTTTREALAKTQAELDANRAQKKANRAAEQIEYKAMPERGVRHLEEAQRRFEAAPPGKDREDLRRKIGRSMQTGVLPHDSSITQLACQTPNCDKSVSLTDTQGDVVCKDCLDKGDVAGKEYRDSPSTVGSTNTGATRNRS